MSSYEFWDELGKIFNAVVAYQEKNLEFNKRFISPWIRLGNVFEKQDRNKEAMSAYERAIELDGNNPQNWLELGNIHFKMENYSEAASAFQRAIELDPGFGWAHSNLGLTLASMGEFDQAVALYQTSIDLLTDPKDKAVAWNRLGNAYRKLNQYEQALGAFHKADELDRDNSGFRDSMDEVTQGPSVADPAAEVQTAKADEVGDATLMEGVSAASPAVEAPSTPMETPEQLAQDAGVETGPKDEKAASLDSSAAEVASESASREDTASLAESPIRNSTADAAGSELSLESATLAAPEETVTVVAPESAQTFTETLPFDPLPSETAATGEVPAEDAEELTPGTTGLTTDVVTSDEAAPIQPPMPSLPISAVGEAEDLESADAVASPQLTDMEATDPGEVLDPAPNSLADQLLEAEPGVLDVAQQAAYEAFLKDTSEPLNGIGEQDQEDVEVEAPGSPEPVAKIDESGELQIEMDTKNAHVWNELGNVYFNTSAFDDAVVAYSKAIELDRWFAWPYSNLALAYVQKRRFVEAILLYQRSIELFNNDKDKAISWNRLGNVYRRLNDYENAIAAYQRADALDPDNSTLSLQSRFSLLGNYAMEQKPSYVS